MMLIKTIKSEKGFSLIETLIGLSIMGIIAIGFLGALQATAKINYMTDEEVSAKIIAESQMECVKIQDYAPSYTAAVIPAEYTGYTADIGAEYLRNSSIQKITVTISHNGREITELESYNVSR